MNANSFTAGGTPVNASHFTALAKAPLPQAALCKGFVIAGAETPRKGAAPVERGPREW